MVHFFLELMFSVPDSPPGSVTCSSPSSISLLISWVPPNSKQMNGALQGFHVHYRPLLEWRGKHFFQSHIFAIQKFSQIVAEIQTEMSKESQLIIEPLEKFQNYSVEVGALTRKGEGIRSSPVHCRTREDGKVLL